MGLSLAILGVLTEQLIGHGETPWPIDAPPALRSEQVAVTAAMLWILQFRTVFPGLRCTINFDCLAAGYATTGQWQAPDTFGERAHLLENYLRTLRGLELNFCHTKAHADDPWNELTDVLAKEAAAGRCVYGAPPHALSRQYQELDLSWLATEARATTSGVLPIRQGCLEWAQLPVSDFRLRPDQLVPVVDVEAPPAGDHPTGFDMRVGTLNVQGFGGNAAYSEEQLDRAAFHVVFFQETKSPLGVLRTKRYLRLHTASLSKWGTAVWIHRRLGL